MFFKTINSASISYTIFFFNYTHINIIYNGYTLIHRTERTVLFIIHILRHIRQFYVLHIYSIMYI